MNQHDEWIVGEGLESPGRWYVIHTFEPRFVAEICDDMDLESGITWSLANGQSACNVEFYDAPPGGEDLHRLILSLGEIVDDYDERVERRTERERCSLDDD